MTVVLLLLGVVVLLVLAGFLAAYETVLTEVDLIRALALEEDDDDGSHDLVWLLEHRVSSLDATLVLTVLVRAALTGLVVVLLLPYFDEGIAVLVAVLVTWVVSALFAEALPRSLVLKSPHRAGLRLASSLRSTVGLIGPIAAGFSALGRGLAGSRNDAVTNGVHDGDDGADESSDDDSDELEDEERAMIRSIFELGDTIAREIMVPRPDMVTVPETAELRELVNIVVEQGYSRLPVYRGDKDQLVGLVYAKDVLKRVALQPGLTGWRDLIRPVRHTPETKPVDDLLREMQEESVHMVLVVDEYGATTGLVTIEDVLEEIVGEIVDEHDHESPLVEVLDDGAMRVDARLSVGDLNELLDLDLPDEDFDTVGGLVVGALGHVPDEGERIEIDRVTITAEKMQGRRVAQVLVAVSAASDRQEAS